MNQRGITLIEMMIAMSMAVLVGAAGYVFFGNTFNFSLIHGRNAEMQRENRMAVDIMSREIRSAGFGVIEPLGGSFQGALPANVQPIQAGNNVDPDFAGNANRLDRITIMGGYQIIGRLNAAAAAGANQVTVTLQPGIDPTNPAVANSTITIGGFYTGTVTNYNSVSKTLTLSPPLNRAYTTLDTVSMIQTVRYRVAAPTAGAELVLYRDIDYNNDGTYDRSDIIASGIEDLQFAYLLNDGTTTNVPPAVVTPASLPTLGIKGVRMTLLARRPDPSASSKISTRPAIEDHAAGAAVDRYRRSFITKVAEARNIAFYN